MSTPSLPPGYQEIQQNANSGGLPNGYQEVPASGPSASQGPPNLNDVGQVAPYAGRALAASLPAVGGIAGSILGGGVDPITAGAGAGLGSVISQELRNEFPKIFGELDKSPTGFATQVGSDVATEGVGPELAGKVLQKGIQMLPSVKAGLQGQRLAALTKEGQTLAGPELAENININGILGKGMKGGKITDPDAILGELNKAKYDFTVSPESKEAITALAKAATPSGSSTDRVLNYVKGRVVLGAGAGLLGATVGSSLPAAGGIVLTDAALGALTRNPFTAKLVTRALETPASAPEAGLITKFLSQAIKATEVPLETKDQ
jgi:hypothetical protein